MKKFILILLPLILTWISITKANAQTCEPIYGGGENCPNGNLSISKMVLNPATNTFVDNLGLNDGLYSSGSTVSFQVKLTNIGSSTVSKITVKDIFPNYVIFNRGPGTMDFNSKTLTFDVNNLTPNQPQTFNIYASVVNDSQLPSGNKD